MNTLSDVLLSAPVLVLWLGPAAAVLVGAGIAGLRRLARSDRETVRAGATPARIAG